MPVEKLDLSLMFVVYGSPEPSTGYLRGDLRAFDFHFKQSLADGFSSRNIQRVLEVGVGEDFEAIKQLSYQSADGKPLFDRENLWAIDPSLRDDSHLAHLTKLYGYLSKFRRERTGVETFAPRVLSGEIAPFDFVFSKGVVSYGSDVLGHGSTEEREEIGLGLIAAMRDCLNPDNPEALLMLATQHYEEFLPFCARDYEDIGLGMVYSETTDDPISLRAAQIYRENGTFRDHPEGVAYNLVICKRLPAATRADES